MLSQYNNVFIWRFFYDYVRPSHVNKDLESNETDLESNDESQQI